MEKKQRLIQARDTQEDFMAEFLFEQDFWKVSKDIIQSEVSQKDKDHYNILTHIYIWNLERC